MKTEPLYCQNEMRRHEVRAQELNGIDYVEVSEDQLSLTVYFLSKAPDVQKANVQIRGGQRIRGIRVTDLRFCRQDDPEIDDCMIVTVDKLGDFSIYKLCLVVLDKNGVPTQSPYHELDPRYACVDFSFKEGCPSDLDCKQPHLCPPQKLEEPEINYLAKDYASFRQIILDRLALIMPDWKERHVPDIGIAFVEVLAYAGDHLSYYQDAVATEAYLDTARQRISVRRHARLVDYRMHEGCNARTWLHLETSVDHVLAVDETYFVTRHPNIPQDGRVLTKDDLSQIAGSQYEVFEPLTKDDQGKIELWLAHNEIEIYTWGDMECCLPKGTTSATLKDEFFTIPAQVDTQEEGEEEETEEGKEKEEQKNTSKAYESEKQSAENTQPQRKLRLKPDDFLLFEEVVDPKTGNPADKNPAHRHVIRLTRVSYEVDALYNQPVVEISWERADALPFPLCISSKAADCTFLDRVSVARGNIVLVDHGRRNEGESLGEVVIQEKQSHCPDKCDPAEVSLIARTFRPYLNQPRLTFRQPLLPYGAASELLQQTPRQALPAVQLRGKRSVAAGVLETVWEAQMDLLESYHDDHHFVVEMDDERRAHLRFGDGELGHKPEAETEFTATYRTGNGVAGNVGAEAITQVIQRHTLLSGVTLKARNPLPATGGTNPEPSAEVKLFAPHAFRQSLQRAVIAEDYAQIVMRDFSNDVQRAAASLRWTGSWYEVLVAVDPFAGERNEMELEELLARIQGHLNRYRRIGHDLHVAPAQYMPLDIEIGICVDPEYLRGHVKAALLDVFSNHDLLDGGRGCFHPDNLSFGDDIYLSDLVASAQAVTGVESVKIKKFQRLYEDDRQAIKEGVLKLGPLEVARLDNDPSFPENGRLELDVRGGR
jgi:hypothetical protein